VLNEVPDAYVDTMTKVGRRGEIFVDFFRNDYMATAVADFLRQGASGCTRGGAA
jgi:DNA primase